MDEKITNFIRQKSPDGGFLQSVEWRKFQEEVGKKTFNIFYPLPQAGEGGICFWANIIEHKLPLVGKYFYIPRGPIVSGDAEVILEGTKKIAELAKKNNTGWIRIEPATNEMLEAIKNKVKYKITKSSRDMQPKEILVMDITKSEEEILAEMKQKTRYNIRLAEKKGVKIIENKKYADEFIKLTKIMAKRHGIAMHQESYYKKMIKAISENILKLYVAEYEGKIVASNLVIFYGDMCTYLHGASDDEYKNIMSPHLLQWRQIQDAKKAGCRKYDFGGVKVNNQGGKSWEGVTRFKTGFAANTKPVEFPGSYDIIINTLKYRLYRNLQGIKDFCSRQ
jgi:peptidoglycan pentaglycine glycine transferase (the first glycine)